MVVASNRSAGTERTSRRPLALAWALGFTMWALLLAVDALLPTIQEELELSFAVRSLVLALPFLSIAVSAIPGGVLADRQGVHRTVTLGGSVAVIGAGLRAVPGPSFVLLVAAAVFGIGLGLVVPNLPKLVSLQYGRGSGGLATGIYSAGLIAGSAAGVYLTGPIADSIGSWRIALTLWAALGAVVVLAWSTFPSPHEGRGPSTHVGYGNLLRRRELWILACLFAAGNASYFFLVGAYPEYLTTRGLFVDDALTQLAVLIAVGIPAIFLAPVLSDRARLRRPFLWGPHALIAALLLVVGSIPSGALPLVSVGLGFGEMSIFALALLLPVDLFSREEVGRASGVVISVAYVGALLGPLGSGIALDVTGSFGFVLVAFALLSIISALLVFALPETGGRGRRP